MTTFIAPGQSGVVGDGRTDDAAAINALLAQGGDIKIANGIYAIGSTLKIPVGSRVLGSSSVWCMLLALPTFNGPAAVSINGGSVDAIADYFLGGLIIRTSKAGTGPPVGLFVGNDDHLLEGFGESKIADVSVQAFAINIKAQNLRQVYWERVSTWPGAHDGSQTSGALQCLITSTGSNFCGDQDWDQCQFTADGNGNCMQFLPNGNGAWVSGIRIGAVFYGGGATTQALFQAAQPNSVVQDVWFTDGSQFEGPPGKQATMMQILSQASGSRVMNIHLDDVYGSGNGFRHHVLAMTQNGGTVSDLYINNNQLAAAWAESISLFGVDGATVIGNHFSNVQQAPNSVMFFTNCRNVAVQSNMPTITARSVRPTFASFSGCVNATYNGASASNISYPMP